MFLILCMHWGIESYTVTVTVWLIDIIKLLTCTRRWGDRIHVGWKSSCSCWCYQCTCDHLHMTVMHLFIKFDGNIFIQLGYIDIIRNSIWRPPPSWIFIISEFDTFSMMAVCFSISVPNLVQISRIFAENDLYLFQTFDWWCHAN